MRATIFSNTGKLNDVPVAKDFKTIICIRNIKHEFPSSTETARRHSLSKIVSQNSCFPSLGNSLEDESFRKLLAVGRFQLHFPQRSGGSL